MSEPVRFERDPNTDGWHVFVSRLEAAALGGNALGRILIERVVTLLAEQYVKDHGAEILAKLDPQAIANLAIAQAASKIADQIRLQGRRPWLD